jgi:hypothetical protein
MSDNLRRYAGELEEMRKQYNNLAREYSHTGEVMRDQGTTVIGYRDKIARLDQRIHKLERATRYKNVFLAVGATALSWLLSLIAILIYIIAMAIDFSRRRIHGITGKRNTKEDDEKVTRHAENAFHQAQKRLEKYTEVDELKGGTSRDGRPLQGNLDDRDSNDDDDDLLRGSAASALGSSDPDLNGLAFSRVDDGVRKRR